jgi:hypothetical protein
MGAKSYFDSAFPEPWQILGVRLRPFSLGHYLKLRQFNSPFVSDDPAPAAVGDLLLGILVCSMSSNPDTSGDEFWEWWNRPPTFNPIARLFRKTEMTPAEREIYKWGKKIKSFDVPEKITLFAEYVSRHSQVPSYWILKQNESSSGAHWAHGTIAGLCSQCGYSQSEAYNVPMGKALFDFLKACEDSGSIKLFTEEQSKGLEAVNGS